MDRNQMVGPDGEVLGAVEDENAVSYFLIRSKHFSFTEGSFLLVKVVYVLKVEDKMTLVAFYER